MDWTGSQDEFLVASAEGEGEASSEGGGSEGEGEGAAAVAPGIQLLTDLGFMQGHAYAGLKPYEMGETELGVEHIGHPIVEKYNAVAGGAGAAAPLFGGAQCRRGARRRRCLSGDRANRR